MRERHGTNIKSKNSYIKGRYNEETSYNYYYSSSNLKSKRFNGIVEIFSCMKNLILSFKKTLSKIISKLSFLIQSIIFKIPVIIIYLLILGICHIYLFELLYFYNYYYLIRDDYLDKFMTIIDSKLFELKNIELQSNFEEVEELLFFNIYFKELINMGIMEENRTEHSDIFAPININSGSIYSAVNNINKKLGINNDYSISLDDANNGFYKSNSSNLCELAKIYYYLLPSITVDQNKQNKYLNQSFLISYEYNESLKEIEDKNYFYFVYPKSNSMYNSGNSRNSGNNFHSGNIKISPKIYMSTKINFNYESKNENNDYDEDNWFSKQDYLFRNNSNNINKSIISFEHLNYNYFGVINKTFITTMKYYVENNNKKYIIDLINFFHQNSYIDDSMSYSLFLLNNNSDIFCPLIKEKYSDNDTFAISQYNITEVSMSSTLDNYFHYGIKDNKNNYFQFGTSFDTFDLNKMNEPSLYYDTILEYYSGLLFVTSIYLFGTIFQRSNYFLNSSLVQNLEIYEFYNENEVNKICSKFNFENYIKIIKENNIDCNNIKTVDLDINDNFENDTSSIPSCVCLALNCLNRTTYSIKQQNKEKKYIIVNRLKLPNKCINNFNTYRIDKSNNNINFVQKLSNKLLKKEEFNYIHFKKVNLDFFPGLSYMLVTTVNNTYLENVLNEIANILANNEKILLIIIIICLIFLFLISILMIIYETKKFSNLIFEFNLKYEKYICKNEKTEFTVGFNSLNDENRNIISSENEPLIRKITRTKTLKRFNINFSKYNINNNDNQNSNPLMNELFHIFCEVYRLDAQNLIEKRQRLTEKTKREIKQDIMNEKNELFQLFVKLCSYESKINLNININLYADSPLIQYFNNSLIKGRINNSNEENFTRNVIYEMLSTENINDEGLITNLNFGYLSYLNMDEFKSIKNALFNKDIDSIRQNFNMRQKLKDDQRKSFMKLLLKNKNVLYNDLQKFHDLDEIKYSKLESYFNQFLLNVYYKYLKKIIEIKK